MCIRDRYNTIYALTYIKHTYKNGSNIKSIKQLPTSAADKLEAETQTSIYLNIFIDCLQFN